VAGGLVDANLLSQLAACRTSGLGELRLRAFHERPEHEGDPPPMGFTFSRFLQRTKGDTPLRSITRFPELLRDQYHADGWFELVRRISGTALVRIGQRLAGRPSEA